MNKFFVKDRNQIRYFTNVSDVVLFLELVVKEKLKMNRSEWMQHVMDLGHGPDDTAGRSFVDTMQNHVEIGCVQKNGKCVRCNIFEATQFNDPAYRD